LRLIVDPEKLTEYLFQTMQALEKGYMLTVSPGMLESLLCVLSGDDLEIRVSGMGSDGKISLSVKTGQSMTLFYELRFDALTLERGRLSGDASYTETRSGGGVGSALLGLTGKSGLAFALSKHKWIKADNNRIEILLSGLPQGLFCSLAKVTPKGMTFRV
jgi:hypothetical protein